jgi:hypothetical protein
MAHLGKATAKALLYVTSPLPLAPLSFFRLPNIYPFVGQLVAAFGGNNIMLLFFGYQAENCSLGSLFIC